MAAHASHSLSGSKRRYACPGSVAMEAPFPDKGNKSSNEGIAMHDVAAWCLTEHRRADLRIGEMVRVGESEYVEFTDDMAELTQGYVDTVRVLGIDNTMLIEQRVDVSPITGIPDQFGTADCIIHDKRAGELMVIDLKTGYRPVSPVGNTQLMLYALGALNLLFKNGNLLAQGQAAGPAAEAAAQGLETSVRPDADHDGQPDAGIVGGAEVSTAAQTQEEEDALW